MKVIIRAVRKRSHFVSKMVDQLVSEGAKVTVYYDDFFHDAMKSFLYALEMNNDEAMVLMEDDIELTSNFVSKAQAVIDQHPNEVIQFFSMRKDDLTIGSRYDKNFVMNQCTYYPAGFTTGLKDYHKIWSLTKRGENINAYDYMVSDYLRRLKKPYWLHVPSLVQHLEVKSMIDSRRSSKRQSKTFVK